jgi:hypothetical protein
MQVSVLCLWCHIASNCDCSQVDTSTQLSERLQELNQENKDILKAFLMGLKSDELDEELFDAMLLLKEVTTAFGKVKDTVAVRELLIKNKFPKNP